jgi:hypothetical protein
MLPIEFVLRVFAHESEYVISFQGEETHLDRRIDTKQYLGSTDLVIKNCDHLNHALKCFQSSEIKLMIVM